MTEQEKQSIISQTNANLTLEGMPLTKGDKQIIKDCLDGKHIFDEAIEKEIKERMR